MPILEPARNVVMPHSIPAKRNLPTLEPLNSGLMPPVSKAPVAAIRMITQDLISTREAADIFGVSERSVRRWLAAGKLPQRVSSGREKKFRKDDIESEVKLDAVELVSISEASKILNHSVRTLRRWVASGKMPVRMKRGRELKFRYADILWLKELRNVVS